MKTQLPADQFWDLFCFITSHGHTLDTRDTPEIVHTADEEIALYYNNMPDGHSVWLQQGWPVAASDNLGALYWSLP